MQIQQAEHTVHSPVPRRLGKSGPGDIRRSNRALIFDLLLPDHQYSRADLGRLTGLSRVAVSDVVASMLDDGLLRECGRENSRGKGKRGTLLGIDPDRLDIISIDASRPQLLEGAVTDLLGAQRYCEQLAITAGTMLGMTTISTLVERLLAHAEHPVGIGIAVPGVVDNNMIVRTSTALGWSNLDLRTPLEQRFRLPVIVDNDSTSAMLAERFFGQGGPNLFFVRIRRGIGAAVLIDDVPVLGETSAGGEIGHISIDPNGPLCACGKRGCLETLISATVLRQHMRGSRQAEREAILTQAGDYLATALAMPVGLLDVSDVCLHGPDDILTAGFMQAVQARLDATTASSFRTRTVVRRCAFGEDVTMQGESVSVARYTAARVFSPM
ncbi:ROK family protein [Bifidobacterium sp.]|jgi:predicted NBD/HSP70 family sugar kinase|uniref:ROK family protein n=1 Tax=Bifidobacterium sp. TaxID=41200 RepID=UPI0025C193D5|nr:ROK family protein [Bifidobacterium sp.]MCH4208771.1 ROK family protein [Bifidobacterium sp.]MCI1224031.1 ROK family protein [Bifidobacterium sp.]